MRITINSICRDNSMDYAIRDTVQVMLVIARGEAQVSITSVDSVPNTLSHDCIHLLKTLLLILWDL